ncbi:ER membrane protein complex subunit 1 [Cytospora mali]|uniref:ER membrane protein complex subunit 1 n=1 Tax=Cytospora mali TaxID=578113 RepID=A0A194UWK0_CYTMA|nr:ER membrane protein complex subunit 1 [Valsa mali var. pyri (nom. inval.)]
MNLAMLVSALLLGHAAAGLVPEQKTIAWVRARNVIDAGCKCFPGDACWPSQAEWSTLNTTVGGRLIATVPLGSPCHDPYYDEDECAYLQDQWLLAGIHMNSSSSVMAPFFANQSCDPWTPREQPCELGNYVHYAVNVTGPDDIIATVNFAQEKNIRLVIRNTGHDYLGRSTGAGSLAVWTHHLKEVTPIQWTSPDFNGTALKLGAGIQGYELLEAASALGRVAISGECPTVGVAGGYTQSGGHSALSTNFGLAADQTLSLEVVTAGGELVMASKTENSDLYWAVSGSGAGNFGVVVSMTIKTYPEAVVSGLKLSVEKADNGNCTSKVFSSVDAFHAALPALVDFGTMVIYYFTTDYLSISALTAYNKTQVELEEAMTPLLTNFNALGLKYSIKYTENPTYYDHYSHYWGPLPDGWIEVGTAQFGGRLISRPQLANFSSAARAIANEGGIFIGVGTNVGPFGGDNFVLPAWRDAVVSASLEVPFSFTDPWVDVFEEQDLITGVMQPTIEKATPGMGTYINEGDFRQPGWQGVFYGSNYDKLLAIKKKWDPEGLFYCDVAVGSEAWTVGEDGPQNVNMILPSLSSLSTVIGLLALPAAVRAVFQDEVGDIDFHYELVGLPQRETTFFHRPRPEDKASLLYTLSDVGVLGALHPSSGAIVWRQLINGNITNGGGHLRAGEGENWVASAYGSSVHAWEAVSGRNVWWDNFDGEVKDLEVMEVTENGRKDVLALYNEDGSTTLRRLHSTDGSVVWEFKETSKDLPLQVSTNVEKVFVISLHGNLMSRSLKVTVLDTLAGNKVEEISIGTKGNVNSEKDVMFVGSNSVAPIIAWTDESLTKLRVNVLGTRNVQEFPLTAETTAVEIHAPYLSQSQAHFLVHSKTKVGTKAEIYHIDLKSNAIKKAYDLPHLAGPGAISTSSNGANVYFTRITEKEITLLSSTSHGVLARWTSKTGNYTAGAVHAVAEVIKKSSDDFAVRCAVVTDADDWVLLRNGELGWSRPEGLSAAVAASWAEIPESEDLVKSLDAEAHDNPLSAYIHRVTRHFDDLEYLPGYLASIPQRFLSSILGTEVSKKGGLVRDSFGFNKLIILATRRGRLYGLDAGDHGKIIWTQKAFDIAAGETWDVKGMDVDESNGFVAIRGAGGEHVIVQTVTGNIIEAMPPGSWPPVQSTAKVDTPSGEFLLSVGVDGEVGDLPAAWTPKQTVVIKGPSDELTGLRFVVDGVESHEETAWTFTPPSSQHFVNTATRSPHDPVASIGRVLGDRRVKYKYLNPNTMVVAAADDAASTLTTYLLDTVSGDILSTATYEGVDTGKPVHCAMSENWFACTFFSQYALRDNPSQSLKGYQLIVSDLYESELANDRGPLGETANFSSLEPIKVSTEPALPAVVSQAYIVAAPLSALAVTETRQGITTRQLLSYLPETHSIYGIPRHVLEPRRVVGRDPNALEMEEGLMKYHPAIEVDPKFILSHERDILGVQEIITAPAIVESTSLVFAYGIDVFGTRVAPSLVFDILGKGFDKISLVGTVLALTAGVMVLGPIIRKKQINMRWKPTQ